MISKNLFTHIQHSHEKDYHRMYNTNNNSNSLSFHK